MPQSEVNLTLWNCANYCTLMQFLLSALLNDPTISQLHNIYNQYIYSIALYSKHSLIILIIAPNSYSEIQQVSHSMGNPPNPDLLIGLQLTAVSSICFCLQRALKSHSLQQR